VLGPWFQNLPHAGGIGHAALQSVADALLLVAVWRRTGSPWIALTSIVVLATAPFDLCLSALVWNPVMGSTLAKMAIALVLLDWPGGSGARVALTAALAWSAVHAYTGAVFVALGVFAALLLAPFARGNLGEARRNLVIVAAIVALLQVPYVVHRLSSPSTSAMGAVTDSVGRILSGSDRPQFAKSQTGYAAAFDFIEVSPWRLPFSGWVLMACGLILAWRYRRDPLVLSVTLIPQATAIVGYALFLGGLDHYYYLSLMPPALLTILLVAIPPTGRFANVMGVALLVVAVAMVPSRIRFAATMHRLPEYGILVDGSRKIAGFRQPMRAIKTEFSLPPTSDPEFVYRILGGRIDRASPWVGVVTSDGRVLFRNVGRES
jgi:hypothetical protein